MKILSEFKLNNKVNFQLLIFRAKNLAGWVDGRMEVKAGLRIAYSNQKY